MEEQGKVGFDDKPADEKIPENLTNPVSAPIHSETQQMVGSAERTPLMNNLSYEKSPTSVTNSNISQMMGSGGVVMGSQKRRYVKKKDVEDPAYMPSTSVMYKRRRKRRVSMGGLLDGAIKGNRPVNERNIERVLDRSLKLTDNMLQMLLSTKDDLKRLCGGLNVETLSPERLVKHANTRKLTEIVDKINHAYVDYHRTIDDITELGKGNGDEDEEYDDDELDDDDEDDYDEFQLSKSKYSRYDNGDEQAVKKRPYHRRQPYNRKQVKTEAMAYGGGPGGNQGNHQANPGDPGNKNNHFNNKNNQSNVEIGPWEIKKEKPWDWPEDKGHDPDPNVSNDLVMTCEPGSDDEALYNVGFPKFNRNY